MWRSLAPVRKWLVIADLIFCGDTKQVGTRKTVDVFVARVYTRSNSQELWRGSTTTL